MFERYCVVNTELAWTHTTYNLCYGTRYVLKCMRIWKKDWKAVLYEKKKKGSFISDRNCGKDFGLFCRGHILCEWFWGSTNTKHVGVCIVSPRMDSFVVSDLENLGSFSDWVAQVMLPSISVYPWTKFSAAEQWEPYFLHMWWGRKKSVKDDLMVQGI